MTDLIARLEAATEGSRSLSMVELSEAMKRSLICIEQTGGMAIAEGGGWWCGANGKRLAHTPIDGAASGNVGTTTIYALQDRGLLERVGSDNRYWRDSRCITPAGTAILRTRESETPPDHGRE